MDPIYKPLDTAKTCLVTGAAGFIGYFLARRLLEQGCQVYGLDNLNGYYDVRLKHSRLELLRSFDKFSFIEGDIADVGLVERTFSVLRPDIVVNLAAQAGVRYSIGSVPASSGGPSGVRLVQLRLRRERKSAVR